MELRQKGEITMRNQSTLLQKIRYMTMITWISFLISPDTALASTAQDIAAASDGLVWESQGALVSRATKEGEFVPGFEHAVTKVLQVRDAAELVEYPFHYLGQKQIYHIPAEKVNLLLLRQAYVENWLKDHVPALIPTGTEYNAAIRILFDYIVNNYTYDFDAPYDFSVSHDSQGAYRILLTGQGICSGYSKLFRGMVEYLPFNAQGVVDYETNDPFHLSVALVSWTDGVIGHEWNAILDPFDHVWYHYDLSETVVDPEGVPRFRLLDITSLKDRCHGFSSEHIYEY